MPIFRTRSMMTGKPKRRERRKEESGKNLMCLQNLLKLLECPVCWKTSELKMLVQCRNGHFGCRPCFSRNRFTLKLNFKKGGPSIKRKSSVISASMTKLLIYSHPDALKLTFADIREALEISSIDLTFSFEVEVFEIKNQEHAEAN